MMKKILIATLVASSFVALQATAAGGGDCPVTPPRAFCLGAPGSGSGSSGGLARELGGLQLIDHGFSEEEGSDGEVDIHIPEPPIGAAMREATRAISASMKEEGRESIEKSMSPLKHYADELQVVLDRLAMFKTSNDELMREASEQVLNNAQAALNAYYDPEVKDPKGTPDEIRAVVALINDLNIQIRKIFIVRKSEKKRTRDELVGDAFGAGAGDSRPKYLRRAPRASHAH